MEVVELTADGLAPADVIAVARGDAPGCDRRRRARGDGAARAAVVERARRRPMSPRTGSRPASARWRWCAIPAERARELQRALIRSHAAGIGPPIEREVVRAMMLLRARTLAMGCSGARPGGRRGDRRAAERRAHAGRARARLARGQRRPCAARALRAGADRRGFGARPRRRRCGRPARRWPRPGIEPIELGAKEGLALINGTDGMLGMLVLAIADLDAAAARSPTSRAAMSVEALLGTDRAFADDLVALRPQPGQAASAANLRALLADSEIVASHRDGDPRVQDAYSLRCAPQVAGAARDTLDHAPARGRRRAALGDRQPDGAARRPRRVVRQLPRRAGRRSRATSSRSRRPRSARSPSGAPTGCSTRPARTGCRRSSPRTRASTPA